MILKIDFARRRDGSQKDKLAVVKCDECFRVYNSLLHAVRRQFRRIGKNLCNSCAHNPKYRKSLPHGISHFNYKNGLSQHGYRRIHFNGRTCYEHRVVAEQKIGRPLSCGEIVHHINNDKLDNNPENIYVFENRKSHEACHFEMEQLALKFLNKGVWFNPEAQLYEVHPPKFLFDPLVVYGERCNAIDKSLFNLRSHASSKSSRPSLRRDGEKKCQHIFIIEAAIGRKLFRDESVHHINGNKMDNCIQNLFLTSNSQHRRMHESLCECSGLLHKDNRVGFHNGHYFILTGE